MSTPNRIKRHLTLSAVTLIAAGTHVMYSQEPSQPAIPVTSTSVPYAPKAIPVTNETSPPSPFMRLPAEAATPPLPAAPAVVRTTDGDYILSPNDTIEMSVFREPDLTTKATISRDGTVQMPLINDVKVAGLTVKQARDLIRTRYNADYLVEPQVSLAVTQFAERKFTIIGQVKSPGTYTLEGGEPINLIEAIGMAGGFTRIADRGHVVIKRVVGGAEQTLKINANRMAKSSSGAPLEIRAGDIISIGESWF
ncbi:MAG: polysaccharide export protein [Terrimicrobiaceae bacterium]|nr:polysaccharide export protein [Terrimicrobiaceae bacterium]